jgi:hypothetical protein
MIYQILGYRQNYHKGMHVNSTYTCYAQYFILKNQLKYNSIFFVADKDKGIATTLSRVFTDEIKNGNVHILNVTKPKNYTYSEGAKNAKLSNILRNLRREKKEYSTLENQQICIKEFVNAYKDKNLYDLKIDNNGELIPYRFKSAIPHPYPTGNNKNSFVEPYTDMSGKTTEEMAEILTQVDISPVDNFNAILRRYINLLERPLSSSDSRLNYYYTGHNMKYIHYLITICRTYVNFCLIRQSKHDELKLTAAQRLGIANQAYDFNDIIYVR